MARFVSRCGRWLLLGVTYIADTKAGVATIVGPDRATVVTVPLRKPPTDAPGVEGRTGDFVAADAVIEGLGGKCEWIASHQHADGARRADFRRDAGRAAAYQSDPSCSCRRSRTRRTGGASWSMSSEPRSANCPTRSIFSRRPSPATHTGQFQSDIARIVLEMKQPYAFSVLDGKPTSLEMILNPTPWQRLRRQRPRRSRSRFPRRLPHTIRLPSASNTSHAAPKHAPGHMVKWPPPPPVSIVSGVTFHKVSDNEAQFTDQRESRADDSRRARQRPPDARSTERDAGKQGRRPCRLRPSLSSRGSSGGERRVWRRSWSSI